MRRIKSALLVTVLTCGLVVTPVFAEPSVDDLKKDKEAAQSEVDSLQSKLTDLLSKISQLEGDLISKGQGDYPGGRRLGRGSGKRRRAV